MATEQLIQTNTSQIDLICPLALTSNHQREGDLHSSIDASSTSIATKHQQQESFDLNDGVANVVYVLNESRLDNQNVCWTSKVTKQDDSSKRSNEEDVYEDLCYVTLRSNNCRSRSTSNNVADGTLLAGGEPMQKRDYCIKELLETEKNYCEALVMIMEQFVQPLSKVMTVDQHSTIFHNLNSLTDLHWKLYQQLSRSCSPSSCQLSSNWNSNQLRESRTISMPLLPVLKNNHLNQLSNCDFNNGQQQQQQLLMEQANHCASTVAINIINNFKLSHSFTNSWHGFLMYGEYCANLPKAQKLLDDLCNDNENINYWVNVCQNKANDGRFKLRDLLSLPMQRILKYHLLLGQLISNTNPNHDDYNGLKQAFNAMLDIGAYINEVKRDTETLEIIQEVQRSIIDLSMPDQYQLKDYGRLIKDGEVKMRSHDHTSMRLKNRYIFIFDKVLLMCKTLRGLQYSYKEAIILNEYKLEEISNFSPISKFTKNWSSGWSLVHVRSKQPYTFYVKNEDIKRKWWEAIEKAQDNVRPKQLSQTDHQFAMCTVPVATCCTGCNKLLKGTWYQGYRCYVCNTVAHKHCLLLVKSCAQMNCDQRDQNEKFAHPNNYHHSPPTPSSSKRMIVKANCSNQVPGQLMFDENDTIIVYSNDGSIWYGRNMRTGQQGSFSSCLVTELITDSPSSSSMDSPTVINCSSTLRFSYDNNNDDTSINTNVSHHTLPKKTIMDGSNIGGNSNNSTPSPQFILMPSSPLAASTPAMIGKEEIFFATTNNSNNANSIQPLSSSSAKFENERNLQIRNKPSTTAKNSVEDGNLRLFLGNGYNLEEYAWFAGSMDRQTAQSTLDPLPNGSFLVRISPKQQNSYAISINYKGQVKHMRVQVTYKDGINATTVLPNHPHHHFSSQWSINSNNGMSGMAASITTQPPNRQTHFYLSERRFFRTIVDLVRWYELNSLCESFNMVNTQLLLPYKKAYCHQVLGYAVALYAFTGTSSAASSFISLRKGDRVTVLSRAAQDKGWWKGQIGDRIGYFPFKYVTPTTNSLKIDLQSSNSGDVSLLSQASTSSSNSSIKRLPINETNNESNNNKSDSSLIETNQTSSSKYNWSSPKSESESAETMTTKKISPCSISPSSSSTSSATTLSSPVNSDTLSIHSRQASSDAGIDIAGFIGDNHHLNNNNVL